MIPTKVYLLGTALLVVITGGYFAIQYIQDIGRQEIQIEKLEENLQIRNRVDAAIRNAPVSRDESIGVLDDFLRSRD